MFKRCTAVTHTGYLSLHVEIGIIEISDLHDVFVAQNCETNPSNVNHVRCVTIDCTLLLVSLDLLVD